MALTASSPEAHGPSTSLLATAVAHASTSGSGFGLPDITPAVLLVASIRCEDEDDDDELDSSHAAIFCIAPTAALPNEYQERFIPMHKNYNEKLNKPQRPSAT